MALQTFYRYFASKDELLLAVIGDAMTDACERWAAAAAETARPAGTGAVPTDDDVRAARRRADDTAMSRFVVSTRWRLHRQFAKELAEAEKPFVDLLRSRGERGDRGRAAESA